MIACNGAVIGAALRPSAPGIQLRGYGLGQLFPPLRASAFSASFITDVSSFVVIRYKYVMGLMLVSEFRSAKVGCFEEMIS